MKKLDLDLENCFGIRRLKQNFSFERKNVVIIYASNGVMKTSLANTLKNYSENEEIKDFIFDKKTKYSIRDENGKDIDRDRIIVIKQDSEELEYDKRILISNEQLRQEYSKIHNELSVKLNELYEKVKLSFTTNRTSFDVKTTLLNDFGYDDNSEIKCLKELKNLMKDGKNLLEIKEFDYNVFFNAKVVASIDEFDLDKYIAEYDRLVSESPYMEKDVIDCNNYELICKSLDDNNFFKFKNKISLKNKITSGYDDVLSIEDFKNKLENEKLKILDSKELKVNFDNITKKLNSNNDARKLKERLKMNPTIVSEYADVQTFKKKVWVSLFFNYKNDVNNIIKLYDDIKEKIAKIVEKASNEETKWKEVVELFNKRFKMPFKVSVSNQKDVILKNDVPTLNYEYYDKYSKDRTVIEKNSLLSVLSTGEKRAFKILEMLFKIASTLEEEYLLVLDDISDSFDYKNKYAIIQYIDDISKEKIGNNNKYKILLLTHNYDFYRIINIKSSDHPHSFYADVNAMGEIKICNEIYIDYFKNLKDNINTNGSINYKKSICMIPFARNICEYIGEDSTLLTKLLHMKADSKSKTLKVLLEKYKTSGLIKEYKETDEKLNESVFDILYEEIERIDVEESPSLDNKILYSIGLRLIAENFIISWCNLEDDEIEKKELGKLIKIYKGKYPNNKEEIELLERVSINVSNNIHLNAFMIESIFDTSLSELKNVYLEAKEKLKPRDKELAS